MAKPLSLSVHGLVDTLLRSGDLDERVFNRDTMLMGSRIHSAFQKSQGSSYLSEVPLAHLFARPLGEVYLQGRADGIILKDGLATIDEIKSTIAPLEEFFEAQKEWHLGQAKCYALLYLLENGGEKANVRLTYISQRDEGRLVKEFSYSKGELERDIDELLDTYLLREEEWQKHIEKRDESLRKLRFPFPSFRNGQREMAKYVYRTAKEGGYFFLEAPTGIGKSMSALYPALKAYPEAGLSKLFYLTAKGSGREAAENALLLLRKEGLDLRSSTLSSREDACLYKGHECNPDSCPLAKGYYDKLPKAREKAMKELPHLDLAALHSLANEFGLCPFELGLDLSLDSDLIIADYNYLIDPFARLIRYFGPEQDPKDIFCLVDEAHNLPERARHSYSESLSLEELEKALRSLKGYPKRSLKTHLKALKESTESLLSSSDKENEALPSIPDEILDRFERIEDLNKRILTEKQKSGKRKNPLPPLPEEAVEAEKKVYRLLRLNEGSKGLLPYLRKHRDKGGEIGLLCLDPSPYLSETFGRLKGAFFFSATLSPVSFYEECVFGRSDLPYLLLPSPFKKERMKLLLAPMVSLRYKDREKSLEEVAGYLNEFLLGKVGNYFFYFPSFSYLANILPLLHFPDGTDLFIQEAGMKKEEREEALRSFLPSPKHHHVALLVLGGAFSEGIDLPSDRLIGLAIVGIGIPQVGFENESLKEHYREEGKDGFSFAYRNRGMNKVMQALGRLIRSEGDYGAALLIDERYLEESYRSLFRRLYPDYALITKKEDLLPLLLPFFKKHEE